MAEIILVGFIAPIVTGLLVWFIQGKLEEKKVIKLLKSDFSKYDGVWHGIHVSKSQNIDKKVASRHTYTIQVGKKGDIKGEFYDYLGDEPWEYDIQGKVIPGGIILNTINRLRPDLFSVQIFFNPLSPTLLKGVIISYDYQNNPFVSPILLTRKEVLISEYEAELNKLKHEYYINIDDLKDYNIERKT